MTPEAFAIMTGIVPSPSDVAVECAMCGGDGEVYDCRVCPMCDGACVEYVTADEADERACNAETSIPSQTNQIRKAA